MRTLAALAALAAALAAAQDPARPVFRSGADMTLGGTGDALRRVAVAHLTLRDVAAGEYILRATLRGGPASAQVSRLIRLP